MSRHRDRLVAVLGRGVIDDPDEPIVGAFDLGVTRGDGCFDATRIDVDDAGQVSIDHLDEHLDRLCRSARALGIDEPDVSRWLALVDAAAHEWTAPGEAMLKMIVTRGSEVLPSGPSTGFVTITPLADGVVTQRSGISVVTLPLGRPTGFGTGDTAWMLGGVKSLSYAVNMAAGRTATIRGADDAVFVSTNGHLLEGPRSALVWRHGESLSSPDPTTTGILSSITLSAVFAGAADDGIETRWDLTTVDGIVESDGAWLVSSGRLVAPITRIDGRAVRSDQNWTARLVDWATRPRPSADRIR